jgi:hypothetical protein
MYYDIEGLCPRTDIDMSRHGFGLKLHAKWRELVWAREMTQEMVDTGIENRGRHWLDACGYAALFDPDNYGVDRDKSKPPGPDAYPMYRPNCDLRVTWGEWGPEHITVPGNACGLDIDRGFGSPPGGRLLAPHNIDTANQKLLLLVVFTWFANDLALNWRIAKA